MGTEMWGKNVTKILLCKGIKPIFDFDYPGINKLATLYTL